MIGRFEKPEGYQQPFGHLEKFLSFKITKISTHAEIEHSEKMMLGARYMSEDDSIEICSAHLVQKGYEASQVVVLDDSGPQSIRWCLRKSTAEQVKKYYYKTRSKPRERNDII